jgi:cytochrome c5
MTKIYDIRKFAQRVSAVCLAMALFISSCHEDKPKVHPAEKVIGLYDVEVRLPQAEGLKDVQAYCQPCHSLRYIEMQPDFPRATWEKTVKKMVATYGAPISDTATMEKIVNYLVAVKGKH